MLHEIFKNTELYKSLEEDDHIDKAIDQKYLLENIDINTIDDLEKILEAFRYWGVQTMPWSIYDFMVDNQNSDYRNMLLNLWDYKYIQELTIVANYKNKKIITKICKFGLLDMLKWFHTKYIINKCDTISEEYRKTIWTKDIAMIVAFKGHLGCLEFLHSNGCPWDERACEQAAKKNRLDCLKYLHDSGCPWNENTVNQALKTNDLRILKYLCDNNCPTNSDNFNFALKLGNMNACSCLHKKYGLQGNIDFKPLITTENLFCLKALYSLGYLCSMDDIIFSITDNYYDVLQFFIENDNRFILEPDIIGKALLCKNFKMVDYLRKKGYYWDKLLYRYPIGYNKLVLVKYLYINNCPLDNDLFTYSINYYFNKNYDILDYLIQIDCPFHEEACNEAIKNRNLDVLKYFRKNKFYWDESAYDAVIYKDPNSLYDSECFYIHESKSILKFLEYLYKNGCPWNKKTSINLVKTFNLDIIKFMFENNLEIDKELYNYYATERQQKTYLKYLCYDTFNNVLDYLHKQLFGDRHKKFFNNIHNILMN